MSAAARACGRALRILPSLILIASLCAGESLAHGAQYGPPKAGPAGAKAPPKGAGGAKPASGAPAPAGAPGRPSPTGIPGGIKPASGFKKPGASGVAGQGSVGSGVPFTGSDTAGAESADAWQIWWHDHEDLFLQLRAQLAAAPPASLTRILTGRGRVERGSSRRAAVDEVREQLIPALLELLAEDDEPEVLDSALIALARCADEADAERVLAAVKPLLSSEVLNVQTSAVLALGIHGSARFVPLLGGIMGDSVGGREAVGGEVPPLVRSIAALSIGLGNHPAAIPLLSDLLAAESDSETELKSCAITGLGCAANDASNDATAELVTLLRDRRLDSPLKAQVPLALARIDGGLREEVVPTLLAAFANRDADDRVRNSLAQALGQVASLQQAAVLDTLIEAVQKDPHVATRHAALMALAELGLRDAPDAALHPEAHERIAAVLKETLRDPDRFTDRPWAALATGVYARGHTPQSLPLQHELVEAWHGLTDPSARGAVALGLGLAGVSEASGLVLKSFRDPGEPLMRGYCALSLGLLGVRDAKPEMLALCSDKATEPVVREEVAMGLALLRDPDVVPALLDVLERAQTHAVSLGVARALGRIGDRAALTQLIAIARDTHRPDSTRGMAIVALGLLGERGEQPWNAGLRALHNVETPVTALQLVFDIL